MLHVRHSESSSAETSGLRERLLVIAVVLTVGAVAVGAALTSTSPSGGIAPADSSDRRTPPYTWVGDLHVLTPSVPSLYDYWQSN